MQAYHPGIVELAAEAVTIEGGSETQDRVLPPPIVVHYWLDDDSSSDDEG